jgi:hypothetical protein
MEFEELAMLDTGAEWSMVSREVAETIPEAFGAAVGEQVAYRTARGPVTGTPRPVPITILADHGRESSVTVSSTVLVLNEYGWSGPPIVLGFIGVLERLRIAIDPGAAAQDVPLIYFGLGGGG